MALFLVQHGKNLPEEKDPEKGLSAEGTVDVECIAQVMDPDAPHSMMPRIRSGTKP